MGGWTTRIKVIAGKLHQAARAALIRARAIGFAQNRTAIALADHPLPVSATTAEQAARDDAVFNELIARLDEEDDDSDG